MHGWSARRAATCWKQLTNGRKTTTNAAERSVTARSLEIMGEGIPGRRQSAPDSELMSYQSPPITSGSRYNIFPVLTWLRCYQREWLRPDLIAGITLAAYLMPAGLADASLANLPPEAGLYACLFSGLVFWLFCSSRQTAITVTSAISVLVGASLSDLAGGDASRFWALASCTAII